MELKLNDKMLLTEHYELHVDVTDNTENTLWVKTQAGKFKVHRNGLIVFFSEHEDEQSGEIIFSPQETDPRAS